MTGGFSGAAVVDLTDTQAGLDGATFRAALVPEGQDPPAVDATGVWVAMGAASPVAAAATLTRVVDDATDPGHYHLAIDIVADGNHELVWAVDADDETRRALVYVT